MHRVLSSFILRLSADWPVFTAALQEAAAPGVCPPEEHCERGVPGRRVSVGVSRAFTTFKSIPPRFIQQASNHLLDAAIINAGKVKICQRYFHEAIMRLELIFLLDTSSSASPNVAATSCPTPVTAAQTMTPSLPTTFTGGSSTCTANSNR